MFRSSISKATRTPLLPSSYVKPTPLKYLITQSLSRRSFTSTSSSLNNNTQKSTAANAPSAHTSIYKSFGRAFAKVFLGGVLTYQIIYWAWVRLEVDEEKAVRNKEIAELERKAREMSATLKKKID